MCICLFLYISVSHFLNWEVELGIFSFLVQCRDHQTFSLMSYFPIFRYLSWLNNDQLRVRKWEQFRYGAWMPFASRLSIEWVRLDTLAFFTWHSTFTTIISKTSLRSWVRWTGVTTTTGLLVRNSRPRKRSIRKSYSESQSWLEGCV